MSLLTVLSAAALVGGLLDLAQWTTILAMAAIGAAAIAPLLLSGRIGWSHGLNAESQGDDDEPHGEQLLVQMVSALIFVALANLVSGRWAPLVGVGVVIVVAEGIRAVRLHVDDPADRLERAVSDHIGRRDR